MGTIDIPAGNGLFSNKKGGI